MPYEKAAIIISILIVVTLFGLWAFLSLGRAGGEAGFEATVNRVEDGKVYATVTDDGAGFLSRKLLETIVFTAEDFTEYNIQPGDLLSGCYVRKNHDGQSCRVVRILVNGQ